MDKIIYIYIYKKTLVNVKKLNNKKPIDKSHFKFIFTEVHPE